MLRTRRMMITALLASGAAVGGFGVASALGGRSSTADPVSPVLVEEPGPTLLPGTVEVAPTVLIGQITALDNVASVDLGRGHATIVLRRQDDGQICTDVTFPTVLGSSCYSVKDIATGLAYGAWQGPDKVVHMVGVLPDDATKVRIAGQDVEVSGNVWYFESGPDSDRSFAVTGKDGKVVARLGPGAP